MWKNEKQKGKAEKEEDDEKTEIESRKNDGRQEWNKIKPYEHELLDFVCSLHGQTFFNLKLRLKVLFLFSVSPHWCDTHNCKQVFFLFVLCTCRSPPK